MEEANDKLYRVNNQGIRHTIYCSLSDVTDICASSVYEIEPDQDPIAVLDELFSFEEAMVVAKKYRKYHRASFEDVAIITVVCFDAIITKAVKSSKVHINMQDMPKSQNVGCHESEVDGFMRPHQKWSSRKGVRFDCNHCTGFVNNCESLQRTV